MLRSLFAAATMLAIAGTTIAQTTPVNFSGQFGQGSIVLSRVGAAGGTAALSNAATAVFLDEFRVTSGRGASASVSYAQSLALGTSTAGQRLTMSGTATSEGALSYARSSSGSDYLLVAGYDAAAGLASVAGTSTTSATPTLRAVGRVDLTGNTNYYTTTEFSGNNIRAAASPDGSTVYLAGPSAAGTGALRTATLGASSGPLTTSAFGATGTGTLANTRVVNTVGNNVYASSSSGTFQGVAQITSTTSSTLPGFPTSALSSYDFVFVNDSTIYIADDRTSAAAPGSGGLQRWNLVSGTWALAYTINIPNVAGNGTAGLRGLTASIDGDDLAFYAVSTDNRLIGISDLLTNTTAATATSAALVANNFFSNTTTSYAFRGVEIIPTPGAASLLALGGLFAARRRRN